MRSLTFLAVVPLAGCALPLLGGCAALQQVQANIQASQVAAHCYAERDYPNLLAADGCTERDVFNGQQEAENQARLQAAEAQLQAVAAQQAQQQEAMASGGMQVFLSRDLGIHGLLHICEYSDRKLYSFNATDICPTQVAGNAVPEGTTGFKVGEYLDGMTKVCVYNALGTNEAVRIESGQICPLSYNF